MIHSLITWLRVAAPPPWTALVLLPIIGTEAIYAWTLWWVPGGVPEMLKPRDAVWMFIAICLGAWRVIGFHPLRHDPYREWLRLTPWTSRLPLPLGPVHLIPQDGLWLALIWIVWHDPQISRVYLPLVFLTSYLAAVCVSLAATKEQGIAWLLAFALAEVVHRWYEPLTALVLASWLYLAAWIGLRRSLARFPWPGISPARAAQTAMQKQGQQLLGWPLDQLLVRRGTLERRPVLKLLAISLLIGWWAYCAASLVTNPLEAVHLMRFMLIVVSVMAVSGRVFGYWSDYRPPISLWGRLWTLRWIIPRYDHILITPVLVVLAALFVPPVLAAWHVPTLAALAATISLVVFLGLVMPPTFEHWRLTGFFRIMPGSVNKVEFEKI